MNGLAERGKPAPTLSLTAPTLSLTAPTLSLTVPTLSLTAPTLSLTAPVLQQGSALYFAQNSGCHLMRRVGQGDGASVGATCGRLAARD